VRPEPPVRTAERTAFDCWSPFSAQRTEQLSQNDVFYTANVVDAVASPTVRSLSGDVRALCRTQSPRRNVLNVFARLQTGVARYDFDTDIRTFERAPGGFLRIRDESFLSPDPGPWNRNAVTLSVNAL